MLYQGGQIRLLENAENEAKMHIVLNRTDTYHYFRMPIFDSHEFQIGIWNKFRTLKNRYFKI